MNAVPGRIAVLAAAIVAASVRAAPGASTASPRYAVVLDRTPFGPPPPSQDTANSVGAVDAAAAGAAEAEDRAERECTLRLVALTRFDGVGAAGFTDVASGRSFLLRIGDEEAGWRLLDLDPEAGCALVSGRTPEGGEVELLLRITAAPGQPDSIIPSPNAPYWTALSTTAKPGPSAGDAPVGTASDHQSGSVGLEARAAPRTAQGPSTGEPAAAPRDTTRLSRQEEAQLRRLATVPPPEGGEPRLSYRLLQRLRAEALRRKADEAREAALSAAAERARRAKMEEEIEKAAETEARLQEEEEEKRRRAGVVAALGAGYDVEVDFELTAQEAASLREAGYDVPEDALDGE